MYTFGIHRKLHALGKRSDVAYHDDIERDDSFDSNLALPLRIVHLLHKGPQVLVELPYHCSCNHLLYPH
jgi:hypothetical protein